MLTTRGLFNRRAQTWDAAHTHDPEKIRLILALSGLVEGMDMLDVGCGTGVLVPYLLEYAPRRVVAVDFADRMIKIAREKVSDPRVEFVCTDVFRLIGAICDCCFLYNSFPHFPDPHRLLAHLALLVRPGGRLVISHSRGKADGVFKGERLFGAPVHPNQALVGLLRPYFRVDTSIDTEALFLVAGIRKQ